MTNKHNFTKSYLDNLKPAPKGTRYKVYDKIRPELSIRITDKGTKSFLIQKRLNNKIVKITLGKYPAMSINQARKQTLLYDSKDSPLKTHFSNPKKDSLNEPEQTEFFQPERTK